MFSDVSFVDGLGHRKLSCGFDKRFNEAYEKRVEGKNSGLSKNILFGGMAEGMKNDVCSLSLVVVVTVVRCPVSLVN